MPPMFVWRMDTHSGFIVFVCGRMNRMAPMCWSSEKLDRVTKSPLPSETRAFSEEAEAGVLIVVMLQETTQVT